MISFDVNNERTLRLTQQNHDGTVSVETYDGKGELEDSLKISNGDFVMLINLFRYVKDNDIQNDFINPHGKNKEVI